MRLKTDGEEQPAAPLRLIFCQDADLRPRNRRHDTAGSAREIACKNDALAASAAAKRYVGEGMDADQGVPREAAASFLDRAEGSRPAERMINVQG
jgi:hypothetical protein